MGILQTDRARLARESRRQAQVYSEKLCHALEVLRGFDKMNTDDIVAARKMAEDGGKKCTMLTTVEGYQCLIDEDGNLIASHIIDPVEEESP